MKSVARPIRAEPDVQTSRQQWAEARRRIEAGSYGISPDGPYSRSTSRMLLPVLRKVSQLLALTRLDRRGRRNALTPQLIELDLSFSTLPVAFDGYRILHLTDTHLDALPELVPVAAAILDGIEVDLLALTGDILGGFGGPEQRAVDLLSTVIAGVRVRHRRLAVLGNHDSAATAEALDEIGFEVLLNRSMTIERGGEHIIVTGLDDVHCFFTEAARAALLEDAQGFRIALVHSAEMADYAGAAGFALYLCGHTHGGQICLPGGRPMVTELRRCHHAARGRWREGEMVGYTSCGLGVASSCPLRFNCPGEVTLITLHRG
jgi:predicted MPP superfamily phosphohydrolase